MLLGDVAGDVFDEIKLCKQKIEQLQLNVSEFMKTDEEINSGTTAELETNMNVSNMQLFNT